MRLYHKVYYQRLFYQFIRPSLEERLKEVVIDHERPLSDLERVFIGRQ